MSTRAKVNANSLFNLKLEDIRSIDFGRNFIAYDLPNGRFKVTFASQNEMEVAVEVTVGVTKQNDPVLKRDFYLDVAVKTTLKAVS